MPGPGQYALRDLWTGKVTKVASLNNFREQIIHHMRGSATKLLADKILSNAEAPDISMTNSLFLD